MDGALALKKTLDKKYEEYVLSELDKFKDRTGKELIFRDNNHLMGWEKRALRLINPYKKPAIPEWDRPLREMSDIETEIVLKANSRCMEKGVPLDFDQSMVIFYYQKKVYVQFFNFNYWWRDTFKELRKARKIMDWHYQDQTDWPDSISEEAQEKRKNVWEGIFKEHDSDVPSQCGFSVDFNGRLQHIIMRWHNLLYRGSLDAW
jgi:hypothetical protein